MSHKPGMRVFPVRSMTFASLGIAIVERLPIAALQPGCVFLDDVDTLPRDVQQQLEKDYKSKDDE